MKLDRLVRLEKRLTGMLDRRLSDPAAPLDPLELLPAILDDVESRIQPVPGGGRVFPFERVRVQVCVEPGRGAAARAVLEEPPGLEARIRERLGEARAGGEPAVVLRIFEGPRPEAWGERPFRIECRARRTAAPSRAAAPPRRPAVRLVVLAGSAGGRGQIFDLEYINIGRTRRVENRAHGAVRHNHLAFADADDDVNATVSRAHAHLRFDAANGCFRVFDDGSAHGTRVLRSGRDLAVPRQGSRGVRLEHADELEFGRARVRFLVHWPDEQEADPAAAEAPRAGSRRRGGR